MDDLIEEPRGGAHRDHYQTASGLKAYLGRTLRMLVDRPTDQLLADRYEKFRRMGVFLDSANGPSESAENSTAQQSSSVAGKAPAAPTSAPVSCTGTNGENGVAVSIRILRQLKAN